MCGFAGFLGSPSRSEPELISVATRMATSLAARGPDDAGAWADAEAGIALGFRRLAIMDLTVDGHQPMHSVSGRYVITFNGEIYNFKALRSDLELSTHSSLTVFRGHSDTEVLLAAIERWGLEDAIRRCVGMFAIALWDRKERLLHLVRDRIGEKPLYYGRMGSTLLFGSELKALRMHPDWRGQIDPGAVALFVRYNYVPAPYSIYRGIRKLPPGTILTVKGESASDIPPPRPYWSAAEVAAEEGSAPFFQTDAEAVEHLDALLRDVVAQQMVADVPLGALLSGGIDSSTVVALMQAQAGSRVKTFTIGSQDSQYSEAKEAKSVAQHLGTDHTELYVSPGDALTIIPRMPEIYDEPFADSSQIPTFLVSELARRSVTVALSGDGGDEVFGGYNRYLWGRAIWRHTAWMPQRVKAATANAITCVSPERWDRVFGAVASLLPERFRQRAPGEKLHKIAAFLAKESPEEVYLTLASVWNGSSCPVLKASEPPTVLTSPAHWASFPDPSQLMMYLDLITYLPDDILVKVDRASMGVGLEVRVPFLDHRVVEFASRLPLRMKIRGVQGKWLLRQVLHRYVPRKLIDRPKTGFGLPIHSWLRGEMREWAEDLLDESRLRREGIFDPIPIRKKWEEHLSGRRNNQYQLWSILMFQAWLDVQSRDQTGVDHRHHNTACKLTKATCAKELRDE